MNPAEIPLLSAHTQHAIEARFALRLAAALSAKPLGRDIEERLRFARETALARAAAVRRPSGAGVVGAHAGGAVLGGWWLKLASVLPLLVLAFGMVLVQWVDQEERIRAAADIDVVLLADELPPTAYADPGFAEYLKRAEP